MPAGNLRRLLHDWFQDELARAPADDPRRTALCLRFHELPVGGEELAGLPAHRAAHVEVCQWCQRALARNQTAQASASESVSISLGLEGRWSPKLRALVGQWLKEVVQQDRGKEVSTPAHFDAQGNLRVHWTGLDVEGPVTVSLVWRDAEVPLASGVARNGRLDIVEPMPGMEVQNLVISQRLLRVRPVKRSE